MANRLPPPPREFNWARMLRTLSFWALLIVGTIALVQLASSRRREEAEITISQFTEELNAGNIASVEISEKKVRGAFQRPVVVKRSEEHTSELQSLAYLVCRLLLEKKKTEIALIMPAKPSPVTTSLYHIS